MAGSEINGRQRQLLFFIDDPIFENGRLTYDLIFLHYIFP